MTLSDILSDPLLSITTYEWGEVRWRVGRMSGASMSVPQVILDIQDALIETHNRLQSAKTSVKISDALTHLC